MLSSATSSVRQADASATSAVSRILETSVWRPGPAHNLVCLAWAPSVAVPGAISEVFTLRPNSAKKEKPLRGVSEVFPTPDGKFSEPFQRSLRGASEGFRVSEAFQRSFRGPSPPLRGFSFWHKIGFPSPSKTALLRIPGPQVGPGAGRACIQPRGRALTDFKGQLPALEE